MNDEADTTEVPTTEDNSAPPMRKPKKAKKASGESPTRAKGELAWFDPADVVLMTDEAHPLYDPRAVEPPDSTLVESMLSLASNDEPMGVLEPVLGYVNDEDQVIIIDGRRRTTAAREANKRLKGKYTILLPVLPREGSADDLFEVMLGTFIRKDDSPLEKARKAGTLLGKGRDVKQVAAVMGCTAQTIRNFKQLLSCTPQVQKAVEKGQIGATIIKEIHDLEPEKQNELVAKMIEAGKTGGRVAKAKVAKAKRKKVDAPPTRRMMSRVKIEAWVKALKKAEKYEREIGVLKFVLGHERAIDGQLKNLAFADSAAEE